MTKRARGRVFIVTFHEYQQYSWSLHSSNATVITPETLAEMMGGKTGRVKLRLFVRFRKSNGGYFIASVPRKLLVKLSGYRKLRWSFKDGWLILEAS